MIVVVDQKQFDQQAQRSGELRHIRDLLSEVLAGHGLAGHGLVSQGLMAPRAEARAAHAAPIPFEFAATPGTLAAV